MLFTIHDKDMGIIGNASNENPKSLHYIQCERTYYLDTASHELIIDFQNNNDDIFKQIDDKCYISYHDNDRDYILKIFVSKEDENYKYCECKSLNLELRTETSLAYTADQAYSFTEYITRFQIDYARIEIGINEISDKKLKLEWDGDDTKLARLLSLANKFDAELEFIDRIDMDGKVLPMLINIYMKNDDTHQGVGTNREDEIVYWGKNVDTISKTTDINELYTAIRPIGKDGLTIASIVKNELDENGNILFTTTSGALEILCPSQRDEYPSQIVNPDLDRYTCLDWTYETDNVNVLYGQALARLKEVAYPAISYEIVGRFSFNIGDTITIQDDGFSEQLIVSARVSVIKIDDINQENNQYTFDNFRALQNKIDQTLLSRVDEQATPYNTVTSTTNGIQFKNGDGTTNLTARLFKGTKEITPDSFIWKKDDTGLDNTTNTLTVNASDVDEKAVYRWEAVISGTSVAFDEVTITDVSDGTDGISPINLVIESSNGYQFKNNVINTTFTAILYQDNKEIDSDGTKFAYVWSKTNHDGTVDTAWNLAHQSSQKSITISNSDVSQRATFNCTAEPLN